MRVKFYNASGLSVSERQFKTSNISRTRRTVAPCAYLFAPRGGSYGLYLALAVGRNSCEQWKQLTTCQGCRATSMIMTRCHTCSSERRSVLQFVSDDVSFCSDREKRHLMVNRWNFFNVIQIHLLTVRHWMLGKRFHGSRFFLCRKVMLEN